MVTSLPTRTPPVSSAAFHVRPKSSRLMTVFAVAPAHALAATSTRVLVVEDDDRVAAVDREECDPELGAQVQEFYRGQGHRLDHPHMPGIRFVPGP